MSPSCSISLWLTFSFNSVLLQISAAGTKLFGNAQFNSLFLNNFHDRTPSYRIAVRIASSRAKLAAHLEKRAWSNMQHLTEAEIAAAVQLIPEDTKGNTGLELHVAIDVIKFTGPTEVGGELK